MQTQKIFWPAVLLTILFGLSVLLYWGAATMMGITAIPAFFAEKSDALTSMIISASAGFLGLMLLIAAVITLLRIMGRNTAEKIIRFPFAKWQLSIAIFAAATSIGIGSFMVSQRILSIIFLPILTLIGTLAPLWIVISIGTRQLELGPRWRAWGIFGLGMTIGPLVMIFLEIAVGLFVFVGVLVYLVMQPELANKMIGFSEQIQATSDPEKVLNLITPYLLNPAAITIMFGYTSLAVPMIEELFKPIGVWLFARQLKTPMAGFAMGILSGTAYALVENLGMSAQAGSDWSTIVLARAGAGLLHITNTGLMGWAITSLVNEKKIKRFFLTYIATVTFHGLWNGAGISLAILSMADSLGKGQNYLWAEAASVLALGLLTIGLLVVLIMSNRKVKEIDTAEDQALLVPPQETSQI